MAKEPVYDTYRQDLPNRPLAAEDLTALRFGVAIRGYAMGQVDDLLDRLAREIADRDTRLNEHSQEIARLHGLDADDPPTVEQPAVRLDGHPVPAAEDAAMVGAARPDDEPAR